MNRKADWDGLDMVENDVLVFSTVPVQMQKDMCQKKLIFSLSTGELLRVLTLWSFVGFDAVRDW